MMKLYCADVRALNDDAVYTEWRGRLSPYRREKADKCHYRADKNLCLGAGILIDCGLREYGLTEDKMEYALGEYGKPYFAGREDICFSLSHSGGRAVAVFSDGSVGCDVEQIARADLRIVRRFFAPEEYAVISGLETYARKNDMFYRMWTLKESYLKYRGKGMAIPLGGFAIIPPEQPGLFARTVDGRELYFAEPDVFDGYRCAVCADAEFNGIECRKVEL